MPPLSQQKLAEKRAAEHRQGRIERFKEAAKREEGWSDELIDGFQGSSAEELRTFIAKGTMVAIKFQQAIRTRKARREVEERRQAKAEKDAAEKARRDAEDAQARAAAGSNLGKQHVA